MLMLLREALGIEADDATVRPEETGSRNSVDTAVEAPGRGSYCPRWLTLELGPAIGTWGTPLSCNGFA